MPRMSRKAIEGTYFHVMIQGHNRRYIFKDESMKRKVRETIFQKAQKNNVKLIAYCIMDNHVHVLMKINSAKDLSRMMAGVNTSYAKYYNFVKQRVGYVFRDRYRAEAIYSMNQLINCIKYIHENPVKAHMVSSAKQYEFSSVNDYYENRIEEDVILETFGDEVEYLDKITGIYDDYNFIEIDNEYGEKEFESFEVVSTEFKDYDFHKEKDVYFVAEQLKKRCGATNEAIIKFMNLKRATYYNIMKRMKNLDF